MQRTEAEFLQRDSISRKPGKAHVTASDPGLTQAGDNGREKGGTQKVPASPLTIVRSGFKSH
ncbi:MAG: hypothetical protein ACE5H4_04875 [Candidatus Thorarchaeota archaeon]